MREGDDLASLGETRIVVPPTKAKKGKKSSQSPDLDANNFTEHQAPGLTWDERRRLDSDITKLADAGSAAVCTLTLLDQEGLPKQVSGTAMLRASGRAGED